MAIRDTIAAMRRFDLDALYNSFLGLPPRHQTIAMAVSGVTLLLLLILPISLASGRLGTLEAEIAEAQQQIETAVTQIQQYRAARSRQTAIEQRFKQQATDSLLTVIQRLAGEAGVTVDNPAERGRESFDIYEEEMARFHVKSVPLDQLIKFLHQLESSTQRIIRVKELIITPVYGNRQLLNAEFKEIAAYRLVGEAS